MVGSQEKKSKKCVSTIVIWNSLLRPTKDISLLKSLMVYPALLLHPLGISVHDL